MKQAFIIISALLLLASAGARAQVTADAGYVYSMLFDYGDGSRADSQGFFAGAAYSYGALPYGLAIGTGMYYYHIGGKGTAFPGIMNDPVCDIVYKFGKNSHEEHYLAVPLSAGINVPFGGAIGLHASLGPVFTCCLDSRSYSFWADDLGAEVERNVSYFSPESNFAEYSRFDILAGGRLGVDLFGKLRLHVGAYYGLLDRSGYANKNLHTLNMQAGLSYLF